VQRAEVVSVADAKTRADSTTSRTTRRDEALAPQSPAKSSCAIAPGSAVSIHPHGVRAGFVHAKRRYLRHCVLLH
jgi:hypothetical protein